MKKLLLAVGLGLGLVMAAKAEPVVTNAPVAGDTVITVDASRPGRVFEGIGAVSAGASSRLLIEYPERQRREVLDYLFKPQFGAGFQHLKVEIGGEVNSTDGIELTHERTRGEENYQRGYEWWLMTEAKKRNPGLTLDSLMWGAPGWIGQGKFYTPDMADYVVKFLQGAQRVHGLAIDYTGIWNETPHNSEWIKLLRARLDQAGLQRVGIVASDDYEDHGWKILNEMQRDPALRAAVARVGVHYPVMHSPASAQASGIILWSSEDGPWRGDWPGAMNLARTLNHNYITGKFTKTEIWSPVTSYYDSLPLPGSGVMRANEPWSGHYEVQPAVWAVAHTTQFARPGWHYLDSACALFPGGSCVALQSPHGGDYSLILETMEAKTPRAQTFALQDLPDEKLHVWRTSEARQFERQSDVRPVAGKFSLVLEPHCLYSLTTTSGQRKGATRPPAARPLTLPYADDFSKYAVGATPRYFSDQAGAFEVVTRPDGPGQVLSQVVAGEGIEWPNHKDPQPETILGDLAWTNYTVSVDAKLAPAGEATLLGRITLVPNDANPASGFRFKVTASGQWELRCLQIQLGNRPWIFHTTGQSGPPLASGQVTLPATAWQHLELSLVGDQITPRLNGVALITVTETTQTHGQAGLACGWAGAQFAHFKVE